MSSATGRVSTAGARQTCRSADRPAQRHGAGGQPRVTGTRSREHSHDPHGLSDRVPAHIAFPIDYQSADAEDLMRHKRNVPGHTTSAWSPPVRLPPEAELRRAAETLRGCARPAIFAGQGARGASQALAEVSELLGAPIAKASLGKDCIPDDHPDVTGGVGVIGTRPTQDAMEQCDGLLVVGTSMP